MCKEKVIYQLMVTPGASLRGEVGEGSALGLPGDKSLSHRAVLLAAMAEGESQVENLLVAGVTRPLLDGLTALGIGWSLEGHCLRVQGRGLEWGGQVETVHIDCRHSATTLRLLAGALAAWNIPAILDGSAGLRNRPMRRIVTPLQQMGVDIQATEGCAPLKLKPVSLPLRALDYSLPVASAQVKSCLLLAALAGDGITTLREPGPSRDHTERMLRGMGVEVETDGHVIRLSPPSPRRLVALNMVLPGDISAASFLVVAALVTPGSQIYLRGVGLNPTRTGLLEALLQMGANLRIVQRGERYGEPLGDLEVRFSNLHGASVGGDLVVRMIDEFPAFAVAAAFASGQSVVYEASELRHKESDRISVLCRELRALGVHIVEQPDGFVIDGGQPLMGGVVRSHGDHRLAMALTVAGLAAQGPVKVQGAEMVNESFPGFEDVLRGLGAGLEMGKEGA